MSNKPQRLHEEKFVIRLPDGMRERIALEARENAQVDELRNCLSAGDNCRT